ncbi:MAG: hypothetical protein QOG88_1342, partial [Actinomycetota bacterium]|nr:hypothetical protein [Actinomycetota bacterium]
PAIRYLPIGALTRNLKERFGF